jgi:predicted nucleotidyltransferase
MIGPDTLSLLAPAVTELKAAGATSVYVFGSVASRGVLSPGGDVDLAVTGVPPGRFYRALGRVMRTLPCSVDLIDLDRPTRFAQLLRERNHLVRIG